MICEIMDNVNAQRLDRIRPFSFERDFDECIETLNALITQIPSHETPELEIRIDSDIVDDIAFRRLVNHINFHWELIEYMDYTSREVDLFNHRIRRYKDGSEEKIKKVMIERWVDLENWVSVVLSREIEIHQLHEKNEKGHDM